MSKAEGYNEAIELMNLVKIPSAAERVNSYPTSSPVGCGNGS